MFVVEIYFCFDSRFGEYIIAEHSEWPAGRAMVEIHFLFSFLFLFLLAGVIACLAGIQYRRRSGVKENFKLFFGRKKLT